MRKKDILAKPAFLWPTDFMVFRNVFSSEGMPEYESPLTKPGPFPYDEGVLSVEWMT